MKHYISYILLAAAATASAQNLSTEITVDRTIVPAERAASRLSSVHPSIVSAQVEPARLSMAEYTEPGTVTRSSYLLAPAAWADTFALSPYRGYASLGYFPAYNLGASAGYDILRTADTRLGVWGQFDGYSYKHTPDGADEKNTYRNNSFMVGADFDKRFGNAGVLTAGADFGYGSVGMPAADYTGDHSMTMADVKAAWYARAGRIGYHVDAALHTFGHSADYMPQNGTELNFNVAAGIIARLGERGSGQRAGLELKADFLSRADGLMVEPSATPNGYPLWRAVETKGSTLGVMSITPYYALGHTRGLSLRLGARIDIGTGGTDKKFHAAPDVLLSYTTRSFAVYARARGGEVFNTQRSLYDYTPFMPVGWLYGRSHLPVAADAGINIGPFAGFGVELFGGWSRADDWLMPALYAGNAACAFRATDIEGFHGGARLSYEWRSLLKVSASAEFAPHSEGSGYYMWRDRASMVVKADATVRPVDKLEITLGYEFRNGRRAYSYALLNPADGTIEATAKGLGCVSDLKVGARYAITQALDVFAHADNVLGRRYSVLPGLPSQGVHGLAGVAFKF